MDTTPAAVTVAHVFAKARPIDWVSVALAFSMPLLVALEPYVAATPGANLPPMGSALMIAALGSLLVQMDAIRKKRAAADDA